MFARVASLIALSAVLAGCSDQSTAPQARAPQDASLGKQPGNPAACNVAVPSAFTVTIAEFTHNLSVNSKSNQGYAVTGANGSTTEAGTLSIAGYTFTLDMRYDKTTYRWQIYGSIDPNTGAMTVKTTSVGVPPEAISITAICH